MLKKSTLLVTALLPPLFLAVMSFHYLPKLLHEVLGILWGLAALLHIWQHRSFFATLGRGRWTRQRLLITLVDFLLLALLLVTVLAGLGISNHLLKDFLPLDWRRSITLHQLHVSLPYALLILSGLHLGQHWQGFAAQLRRGKGFFRLRAEKGLFRLRAERLKWGLGLLVVAVGIYGSFLNRIGDRLLLKHIFATPATGEPAAVYLLLLCGVGGMYLLIGRKL